MIEVTSHPAHRLTGKEVDKPSDLLPYQSKDEYCENGHDDTRLIYNCLNCGAPVCCPECCSESEYSN
jgi:hypothetical protein